MTETNWNNTAEGPCKVAVVLLTYNCQHLIKDFLPRILSTTPDHPDYRVYVVDNASTDGTSDWIEEHHPGTRIIRIKVNRGFTNGYKESLALIDADYFVLVSSDVEVSPNWLEPVVKMMDSDESIAVVQPKIRSFYERDHFEYAGASGGYLDRLCYPFCRGRIFYTTEKDEQQYQSPEEIFWASGACFFIRSHVYKESGGLDDDFYAHMEEIDLCWRIQNMGYKIMVCPESEVYHMGGAVITYGSPAKVFRNHRNNLIMMIKNLPPGEVWWQILLRFLMDDIAFVKMLFGGQAKASFSVFKAHINFCWYLPKWIKKRRGILRQRVRYNKKAIFPQSIVRAYFMQGKHTFDKLGWKP